MLSIFQKKNFTRAANDPKMFMSIASIGCRAHNQFGHAKEVHCETAGCFVWCQATEVEV